MERFDKVCNGLECHAQKGTCGGDCPYYAHGTCSEPLCADALALIQKQQARIEELEATQTARVMSLEEVLDMSWDYCYLEEETIKDKVLQAYCGKHRVKCITWPSIASYRMMLGDEAYGKRWRCWTQRPTDEQREDVQWN